METLKERYKNDPFLLAFHKKKLLEPDWPGQVDNVEADYIAKKLNESVALRRLWQVRRFTRYHRRITPAVVKRMVLIWS
ncbi:hypothetical protein ACFLVY_00320 [Chloroflexota bacterium]